MISESYPQGVPISIKYPMIPVYEFWRNSSRKFPQRGAIIYLDAKYTYSELWDQMERFAANLMDMGIRKGDRVALLLPNCPQFLVAYNAVHLCGGTVVTVNPLLPVDEIGRQLKLTNSKIFIILDRLLDKLPETYPELIIAEAAFYASPKLRAFSHIRYRTKKIYGAHIFEHLIKSSKVTEYPKINPTEDIAVILFTSGTTGPPKGVMLTHYSQVVNALQSYHWLRGWGYSEKPQRLGWPIILCAIPFFHSYGLVVMNEAVSFGCTLALIPQPNAEEIMKVTEKHKVTHFPLIPRLIRQVLEHPKLDQYNLSSITKCSSGGAHISVNDMKAFEKVCGSRMYQGYGLTEAGPIITSTPVRGEPNYYSAGLPYPDTCVKIVDLQLGEIEQPLGKEGEIIVRGPQLMKGYLNTSDTASVLKSGWLYTGDIGKLDEKGYLYIIGRKKDKIVASGHTVWPSMVEDILMTHPSVKYAVAFGVPDPLRCSTDIRVMVVLKKGINKSDVIKKELFETCREKLQEFEVPTNIRFRDSLPLTLMGKVDRKKIIVEIDSQIDEYIQSGEIPEN
jgi:long-chain acyl-CoA synthetase